MLRPRVGYAQASDGVAVAYGVVGHGPVAIVLVPPLISQVEVAWEEPAFVHFVSRLAVGASVILFDRRGSGLSDPIDADTELDLTGLSNDVVAVLDACGISRAAVFAASMGGFVGVQFAADHPQRTAALVLMASSARLLAAPDYTGMDPTGVDDFVAQALARWGEGASVEADGGLMAANDRYREWAARLERHSGSPRSVARTLRAALAYDVRPQLAQVQAPTLVIHRRDDPGVTPSQFRYLVDHVAGATALELDGDTHTYFLGDQDEVLFAIREFVDEHVAGGALRAAARSAARSGAFGRGWEALTASEREVAMLIGKGFTNAEVAERLSMSRFTVDGRLRRVYQKLHVSSRAELAAQCAQAIGLAAP